MLTLPVRGLVWRAEDSHTEVASGSALQPHDLAADPLPKCLVPGDPPPGTDAPAVSACQRFRGGGNGRLVRRAAPAPAPAYGAADRGSPSGLDARPTDRLTPPPPRAPRACASRIPAAYPVTHMTDVHTELALQPPGRL